MSFVDLEAGTLRPAPLPVAQVAAHAVFKINTKVAALRHLGDALGTPKDTPALRGRLRAARVEAVRLAKITSQKLKQAADDGASGDTETETGRIAPCCCKSKLTMDFETALRDLRQVLQSIVAADQRHVISAAAAGGTTADETQQQLLATTRMEEHEADFNEKELGILEAEHAITEIDGIFRNFFATLVDEDGCAGSVDHVVCDIEKIAAATSQVAEKDMSGMQVETPLSLKSSSTRCLLTFFIALCILIFVLMIV
ncbi:unnamed protein product [Alopecurus aequalis]